MGELSAINWFLGTGASVSLPMFENPDYDLLVDFGDRIERVQVKTSICWVRQRYAVQLATRGGNQSWNGTIKYLTAARCDSVFIHVGDGRRWYIPTRVLGGDSSICLGGPKYAEFQVTSGEPLPGRVPRPVPATPQR
jgi:hypothetical protein